MIISKHEEFLEQTKRLQRYLESLRCQENTTLEILQMVQREPLTTAKVGVLAGYIKGLQILLEEIEDSFAQLEAIAKVPEHLRHRPTPPPPPPPPPPPTSLPLSTYPAPGRQDPRSSIFRK